MLNKLEQQKDLIIVGPPPTPNGNLHLGHIAGPYMSADVLRRWYRLNGLKANFVTGTDDSQTYVKSSAAKHGIQPRDLCKESAIAIQRSLQKALIDVDGFADYDEGYIDTVRKFVNPLKEKGVFKLVKRKLPFDVENEQFIVEGLVSGECPHCLSESRGALCEACGKPFKCEELLFPCSNLNPESKIEFREVEIYTFPLESMRTQLESYYSIERLNTLRPAARDLVTSLLAETLPEFPITYPLDWGIPCNFEETPGQVFNAWVEGMPASMYCTASALDGKSETGLQTWESKNEEIVYFLGFDNIYFWGVSHLALLLAHDGKYALPETYYSNHFYELNDEKFSTSKGHVIGMEDLLKTHSPEAVRFYLCWTSPEFGETSFNIDSMNKIVKDNLINDWNEICTFLEIQSNQESSSSQINDEPIEVMERELSEYYSLSSFSTKSAAKAISKHLKRIARYTRHTEISVVQIKTEFHCIARLADPLLKLSTNVEDLFKSSWIPSKISIESNQNVHKEEKRELCAQF